MKGTHWHILGPGSMGCLWAAYLAKAGHNVTLLCKTQEKCNTITACLPLLLKTGQQEQVIDNVHISSIDAIDAASITHLLICLKAHQTEKALLQIKPAVSAQATMVLMQNGMGNLQLMEALFPDCNLHAALTTEAACKYDNLKVEHTGHGLTRLGSPNTSASQDIIDALRCDLPLELDNHIEQAMWQKLVINCCINPLTVIHRCKNGELASNPEAMTSIKHIIGECRQVSCAIDKSDYLNDIEHLVNEVIDRTALNTSSMLQDILNHRKTEIDYINGFISRLGKHAGIPTPVNDRLVTLIKDGEYHA